MSRPGLRPGHIETETDDPKPTTARCGRFWSFFSVSSHPLQPPCGQSGKVVLASRDSKPSFSCRDKCLKNPTICRIDPFCLCFPMFFQIAEVLVGKVSADHFFTLHLSARPTGPTNSPTRRVSFRKKAWKTSM